MDFHEILRDTLLRLSFGRLRAQGLSETYCLQTGLLYAVFIYM